MRWNFQKYLISRTGEVLAKFDPRVAPNDEKLGAALDKALSQPMPPKQEATGDAAKPPADKGS